MSCRNFPESHTGANIAAKIRGILEEWGLDARPESYNVIVRDGASNMRSGCNLVPIDNFHCMIHLLQLTVGDAVLSQPMPKNVVTKCRALCTFLHSSSRATAAFRKKADSSL